ncbi:hypothetical protein DFJ74DRAFT_653331 [Hyaloraphidium curvatum]|nr:hypothetical protein DFJ74DRAFT_653331 [Hyaloraphidium curvatum]
MFKQALRRAQRFFTESIPEAAETVIDSFKAIFAEMSNDSPTQHETAAAIASIDTPTEEQAAVVAAVQTIELPKAAEVSAIIPIASIVAQPCTQTGIDIAKILKDNSNTQTSPAFEPKDIKDSVSDALALDEVDADSDSDSTAAPSPTSTASSCGSDDTVNIIDQCRIKFQILKAKVFKPRKARPALANPKSPAALAIANNLLDLFTASFEQGAAFANFVAVLDSTEELGRTPKECLDARARQALALLKTLGGVRDWLASTSGYVRRLKVVHDTMAGITGAAYAFLATVEQYQSELRGFARQMNGATGQACERMADALEGVKTGLRTLVRGLVVVAKQIQMACRTRALSYPRKGLRFEHLAALCDGVADLSCIVEGGNLEAEQELLSLEGNIFDAYDFAPRALIAELEALDRK